MKKLLSILVCIAFAYMAYGQSPFGTKQNISSTGSFPRMIDAGKLNNDAYVDIVIGTDLGGTIEWYKNNGNGTFTKQTLITSTLPRIEGLVIADLDNDNDLDVIATSYSGGKAVWFQNNGSGSFGTEKLIATGLTSAGTVKAGDIDGNGTIDVVVSSYGTHKVSWFSNNGSGTFGTAQIISGIPNSGPLDFDLADYDKDGDLDVVVAYGLLDAIILFDNALSQTGIPSFLTSHIVDSANYGLMDVRFGDVDNNGDLEIIKADQFQNTAWYNKSGSGFTKTNFSTSNTYPSAVGIGDIDGDGRNGVVVGYASTASTDKVTWYKNSSSSGETTIDNSQNDIYDFVLRDFDNDGDLDMASVSSSQNQLNWFKNISTGGGGGGCTDSDGDSVCDSVDQCPGFDDRIDSNGNGIPDGCETSNCTEYTANFADNPLTHSGSGSKSTTLTLPSGSQNISFSISGIDEKTKGKEGDKYIDRILVTYKDAAGITKTNGTYRGDQVSSATISIPNNAQSITVKLDDAYDGNAGSSMSVSLSPVNYCSTSAPAPAPNPCTDSSSNFSKNPLTNPGTGSSSTTLTLPANSQDASFTISGLDSRTKGKQGSLYIETVIVTYVDGSGVSKTYGTYNGANVSSATINISGKVKSITVSLSNFSGSTSSTLSINLSAVAYCINSGSGSQVNTSTKEVSSQQENIIEPLDTAFKIYPNPASSKLYVKSFEQNDAEANIALYNMTGMQVRGYNITDRYNQVHELDINGLPTGLYIMRIIGVKGNLLKTEQIIIK